MSVADIAARRAQDRRTDAAETTAAMLTKLRPLGETRHIKCGGRFIAKEVTKEKKATVAGRAFIPVKPCPRCGLRARTAAGHGAACRNTP